MEFHQLFFYKIPLERIEYAFGGRDRHRCLPGRTLFRKMSKNRHFFTLRILNTYAILNLKSLLLGVCYAEIADCRKF